MTKETSSTEQQEKVISEIINNATEFSLENQELILLIAKSMKCTRDRKTRECEAD